MEGGREGGRAREGDGGKWPYCFQGHLAFPFRATRGVLSPLRLRVLNKQISLSPQTVSCLITSHIRKGLRRGFMLSINRARCGTWLTHHQKATQSRHEQDYLITHWNHIYTNTASICKKKAGWTGFC